VHRDLKPANLFLTHRSDGSECIKVLDFGISKLIAAPAADDVDSGSAPTMRELTNTSQVLGSPPYMSPEQLNSSKHIDQRTDIWALGVTLFELLTKKRPFGGTTLPQMCAAIITQPPADIRAHRKDVPDALAAAIERCLEKDPTKRFRSLAELAVALAPASPSTDRIGRVLGTMPKQEASSSSSSPKTESIEASAIRILPADLPQRGAPPEPQKEAVSTAPSPRRSPSSFGRTGVALVVLACVVTITIALMIQSRGRQEQEPPDHIVVTTTASSSSVSASASTISSSQLALSAASAVPQTPSARPSAAATPRPPASPSSTAPSRVDQKGLASDNPFR